MQAARIFSEVEAVVNEQSSDTSHTASGRRSQASRSAATRAALVDAAGRLFAEKGYADAGREEIVAAAGVTRGALYHHYADKADLFRAVFEATEEAVMGRVAAAAMAADDPLEQLRLGCHAYLDEVLDPGVRRICLIDAPAVLPDDVRIEVNDRYALGMVRETIEAAIDRGLLRDQPVDALAHVLLAAVMAAAQFVATADGTAAARADAGRTIDALLGGLRA